MFNQNLQEHICLECEKIIALPRKKQDVWPKKVGAQTVENWGELPLLDEEFDLESLDEYH